jgi:predicted dehydrogenase
VRIGLVGTGYWAEATHAPALAHEPAVTFEAVWGRDARRTKFLAGQLGLRPYTDYGSFLQSVDAVAFSVPPHVQAGLAIEAAQAGKHLLLEKPIATSAADAERLVRAVEQAQVASVVNFTWRFNEDHRVWITDVSAGAYLAAWVRCFSSALAPGSPYASSPWRKEKGALWDVGPHVLAMLIPALGPVTAVTAEAGSGDLVHLVLRHDGGATSTVSLTLSATQGSEDFAFSFWGPAGVSDMPSSRVTPEEALRLAARELAESASQDRPSHPCDVHLGAAVVRILAAAEQALAAKGVAV